MPEHPLTPFIRILGECVPRDIEVGQSCSWRVATHTVTPEGTSEPLFRHVQIVDDAGRDVYVAPVLEVPARAGDLTRFDNQHAAMDVEYDPVIAVDELPPGRHVVRARLETKTGAVVCQADLPVRPSPPARLLSRIKLAWQAAPDQPDRAYLGGNVRVGDVDGDGCIEVVHAVGTKHICAYRLDGTMLWRYDDPDGVLVYNTAPFRVHDIDGDGQAEIIIPRGSFGDLKLAILDGATGQLRREVPFPLMKGIEQQAEPYIEALQADSKDLAAWLGLARTGHTVRYLAGGETRTDSPIYGAKVLLANFRGSARQDLLVQLGDQNCTTLVALDDHLNILWQHHIDDGYGGHNPALYDVDGDGKDEVIVGTRLLDHDGTIIWKKPFEEFAAPWEDDHIDQAQGGPFGPDGSPAIIYSCRICLDARTGRTLWVDPTWHGQEVHAANILGDGEFQFVFCDREYRHSGHLCHGTWLDARRADGSKLWSYRHAALHMHRMLDWNGDGRYEIGIGLDLQRRPTRPNLGVFDGHGSLISVLPRYGFGADINGDGYDELVSWTQWPDVAGTIEIFGMEHGQDQIGKAAPLSDNAFCYDEPD